MGTCVIVVPHVAGESEEMKIYGDYTFLLDKLNVWNNSQVKTFQNGTKVVEFADKFLEQQRAASTDQVDISREGMNYMRDQLSDLSSSSGYQAGDGVAAKIAGDGLSLMDGLCRTYILQRLDGTDEDGVSTKLYNEMAGKYKEKLTVYENRDIRSHAESLAAAYLAERDKIMEGYANGTREVWTMAPSTGDDFSGVEFEINGRTVRYRKISMEEELTTVEKTFEELVKNVSMDIAREAMRKKSEAGKEGGVPGGGEGEEVDENTKEFWDISKRASNILDELDYLIKKILEEEMRKKKAKEPTLGDRLAAEQSAYGVEIAARGKRQAQYANYKKMNQLASDAQTLLGYIKA